MDTICFCGVRYSNFTTLRLHANQAGHHIRCDCAELFKNFNSFHAHSRAIHGGQGALTTHPSLTISNGPTYGNCGVNYVCNFCDWDFETQDEFEAHLKSVRKLSRGRGRDQKHLACATCKEPFAQNEALEQHKRRSGHCFCEKHALTFATPCALLRHLADYECFYCTICSRLFDSRQELSDHDTSDSHAEAVLLHQGDKGADEEFETATIPPRKIKPAKLPCRKCNRIFNSIESLRQHEMSTTKHSFDLSSEEPTSTRSHEAAMDPSSKFPFPKIETHTNMSIDELGSQPAAASTMTPRALPMVSEAEHSLSQTSPMVTPLALCIGSLDSMRTSEADSANGNIGEDLSTFPGKNVSGEDDVVLFCARQITVSHQHAETADDENRTVSSTGMTTATTVNDDDEDQDIALHSNGVPLPVNVSNNA